MSAVFQDSDFKPAGRMRAAAMNGGRPGTAARGFTLLEVMIALAVVAIAMLALLGLHHQNLESVIRAQDLSRAAMLAQTMMTQVEMQVASGAFPDSGTTSGDFQNLYPGEYPNFRWVKTVAPAALFPDVRKITVDIEYGPAFGRRFEVVEYVHDPRPQPGVPPQSGAPGDQGQ